MEKRLLIITRSRLNENNGGANASKGFIKCFAELFDDCSIIFPAFDETIHFIPAKFHLFPYHDRRNNIHKGLDVYRGRICANEPLVKKHLAKHTYDIIVIDNSFAGASLVNTIKKTGAKLITIHHNVERDYQKDSAKDYSVLFRYPYLYFAKKAEKDCLLNSNVNLTLTAKDATTFQSWYNDKDLHLHQWGIFEYKSIEERHFEQKKKGFTFVITGSLYFMQSLKPILTFVNEYWPLILKIHPHSKLLISGRNPAELLKNTCEKEKSITIIPNPDNIATVVCTADYYICPINVGSGLKLRLLDGLKQGLPVLSHEVSTAGYESLESEQCVFSYNDKQSFVNSFRKMLASKTSPDIVYKSYQRLFSIENGINRLRTILIEEGIL